MASKVVNITSPGQFRQVLSSSTFVVIDFYADWCGPCKTIAPIFEQLANSETKAGRIVFIKVNVDNQRSIASQYSVSAMPTFLILRSGTVQNTIQGADPSSLRSAVMSASALAAKAPARQSSAFTSKGHVLGSDSNGSAGVTGTTGSGITFPSFNLSSFIPTASSSQSNALVPTLSGGAKPIRSEKYRSQGSIAFYISCLVLSFISYVSAIGVLRLKNAARRKKALGVGTVS